MYLFSIQSQVVFRQRVVKTYISSPNVMRCSYATSPVNTLEPSLIRRSKNYHAHDEAKAFKVGDQVAIEETRPISRLKRWIVVTKDDAASS